ncbi:NAD(P)/FAD-dependent oxidoreductase [Enterococcus pseudoavium]|uniref:NAD(P)/FAD-dependent oxidoreductase n=1 Tax=Enterococcus pseudoavium TaxID=44007 RepID=A0ABU3FIM1_9ENTE|nr:NAD(P)/FAD-dependent oxidoreductase [Enterococcus pseudoavium]MDT2755016.1 NAD(P)/FAD-dependent oxidoreductase [Enterococcus pseudoavium]MDT2770903.1 NAD(P)/FAD-dependent oxidoreductase [Enterococcus pseudoavium]
MINYDAIVIGSGPAGNSAAYGLKAQGKKVAVIESDLWGGTCPNRGCDPKKLLMSGVEAQKRIETLVGKGFEKTPKIIWEDLMAFKRNYTDFVPQKTKAGLDGAEIDRYQGQASFIDAHQIIVDDQILTAEQFLIATGQRPAVLQIDGQDLLQSSTDFLALEHLPKKITFIGAGYIAFELAVIANAAGSEVHIIHHNDRPLKEFDQGLVEALVQHLEESGIQFHFNIETKGIELMHPEYRIIGKDFELVTDLVIGATGRVPNVEGLNLEKAGVAYDKRGIQVNERLQTTQSNIFACGDVIAKSQPKLTPVASFEADYVVQAMQTPGEEIIYPLIPTIVFGDQRLARIGLSERAIANQAEKYHSKTLDLSGWYTYRRINDQGAKIKFVYDEEERIVAITCLSQIAEEVINYLLLILTKKMSHEEVEKYIFAYPSPASDLSYFV